MPPKKIKPINTDTPNYKQINQFNIVEGIKPERIKPDKIFDNYNKDNIKKNKSKK